MAWFDSRLVKALKKVKPGDEITIYTPTGYCHTISDIKYYRLPLTVRVKNNDVSKRKLWCVMTFNTDKEVGIIMEYSHRDLSDFILLNVKTEPSTPIKPKTKEELRQELNIAVQKNNFELAEEINKKLK